MVSSLEKVISHYQRDIEKITSKQERALKHADRLLHCVAKLDSLPVTVEHLQTTGVGKTVNSLRKISLKNGINEAAKALVAKWKNMVIEEDDDREAETLARLEEAKKIKLQVNEYSPEDISESVDYKPSYSTNTNRNSYSPDSVAAADVKEYSPSKKPHTSNGYSPDSKTSNSIEVYCYSPSKKADSKKDGDRKADKSKSSSENKSDKEKSSKSSSSHEKSSHSRSSSSKSKSSSSSSRNKSSHGKSSSSSSSNSKRKEHQNGIDSVSGASFAEALGPIVVKKSSSSASTSSSKKKEVKESSSDRKSSSSSSLKKSSKASTPSAAVLLDPVSGPSHLAPLDIDVVSTLSTPTPNYRPMPQTPLTARQRAQDEEDALATIMSNRHKNARTKVYSGVKGGYSYVPSLYEICCNVLKQNIDALEYTGGIPFDLLKPILDAATPTQLYQFEHYNPYIIGETDHLWKFHVNREFRGELPEEMESSREMYLRCVDEREAKYKAVTANIQKSIKTSTPVRTTKLAYVDVAKPPRSVIRLQKKNGTSKPDAERLMGKGAAEAVVRAPPPKSIDRPKINPQYKPKVAPLMQKTLKSIKMARLKR